MTTNALQELLDHIDDRKVIYVKIQYNESWNHTKIIQGTLNQVTPFLNFDYDDGFGTQYLEGTIWYSDGTWSSREEYDGSEWWAYRSCPPLPPEASQPPALGGLAH